MESRAQMQRWGAEMRMHCRVSEMGRGINAQMKVWRSGILLQIPLFVHLQLFANERGAVPSQEISARVKYPHNHPRIYLTTRPHPPTHTHSATFLLLIPLNSKRGVCRGGGGG